MSASAQDLDSAGTGAPGEVDAGDMAGLIEQVLAQLVGSAAELAEGLDAAGAALSATISGYVDGDQAAAAALIPPGEG
ncbi:MAG: hypothetical protein LBQ06_02875 [Frankiaceae bacterium]|nr:hypothetical protein [Frankiaceae bacterium]